MSGYAASVRLRHPDRGAGPARHGRAAHGHLAAAHAHIRAADAGGRRRRHPSPHGDRLLTTASTAQLSRLPWAVIALIAGGFGLAGLPLTAQFASRWALLQLVAETDPRWALLLHRRRARRDNRRRPRRPGVLRRAVGFARRARTVRPGGRRLRPGASPGVLLGLFPQTAHRPGGRCHSPSFHPRTLNLIGFESRRPLYCRNACWPDRRVLQWRTSDTMARSSRISGFYNLAPVERQRIVADWAGHVARSRLRPSRNCCGRPGGLTLEQADKMVENVVGTYALPLGIATNFVVNGRDVLVPMVIEEPSVVAGASFAARLARAGGGFHAETTEPLMIGQMQVLGRARPAADACEKVEARQAAPARPGQQHRPGRRQPARRRARRRGARDPGEPGRARCSSST